MDDWFICFYMRNRRLESMQINGLVSKRNNETTKLPEFAK